MARPLTLHHASGDFGYPTKPLLDFVTGLIAREDTLLRAIREETPGKGQPPISIGPDDSQALLRDVQEELFG